MTTKVALITGATGQDGAYLSELLLDKGYDVHGVKRRSSSFNTGRVDHLISEPSDQNARFKLHFGDLTDATNLIRLLQEIQPTEIYNLAAQSHVMVSFETPEYTANSDGLGTLRLLEAMRILKLADRTRFYQASTSELYGKAQEIPQRETTPFYPRSPYGVAKLYGYWITVNYREAYGFHASNGILFNHESPLRGETFITRKVTRAVAAIECGLQNTLIVGNLNAERDWGHARDFVEGMWLILQQPEPVDYVLATGVKYSVRTLIEMAFGEVDKAITWTGAGLEEVGRDTRSGRILVKIDPRYYRPTEVDILLGDASKARHKLGGLTRQSLPALSKRWWRLIFLKHAGNSLRGIAMPKTDYQLSGKRVWVAGHTGMVGSSLTGRLGKENCEILTFRGVIDQLANKRTKAARLFRLQSKRGKTPKKLTGDSPHIVFPRSSPWCGGFQGTRELQA